MASTVFLMIMVEDQQNGSRLSTDSQTMMRECSYIVVDHKSVLSKREIENNKDLAQMAL